MIRLRKETVFSKDLQEKANLQALKFEIRRREFSAEVAFPNDLLDTIASSTPGFALPG